MIFNIARMQAAVLMLLLPVPALAQTAAPPAAPEDSASAGITLQQFEARSEKRIMAADTDGDGRISKAEYLAAAKPGRGDPARRFAMMDLNGDGYLDKSEIDAMLEHRFKRLDTNGDGVISPAERAAAMQNAGAGENAGTGAPNP